MSSNSATETAPIKRPRGRPRKNPLLSAAPTAKKPRGRPRKKVPSPPEEVLSGVEKRPHEVLQLSVKPAPLRAPPPAPKLLEGPFSDLRTMDFSLDYNESATRCVQQHALESCDSDEGLLSDATDCEEELPTQGDRPGKAALQGQLVKPPSALNNLYQKFIATGGGAANRRATPPASKNMFSTHALGLEAQCMNSLNVLCLEALDEKDTRDETMRIRV